MLPLASLWLPIVVSTAAVFIVSALVWMAGPHHRKDVRSLPSEPAMADALRAQQLKPGLYRLPGAFITVVRSDPLNMGRAMALTAVWYLAVSILIGFLAAKTMGTMTPAGDVFCVTALTAFLAYAAADGPNAIWWGKPWSHVLKHIGDAALYALATGAAFMWFWPE